MRRVKHQKSGAGFTIIEILMGLAILSVLLGIVLPTYQEHRNRVDIAMAKKDIVMISQRLERFHSLNYHYPEYLSDVGFNRQDPWGNEYQYLNLDDVDPKSGKIKDGSKGPKPSARKKRNLKPLNTDYDLFSMGKDGDYRPNVSAQSSLDDIIRADDGDYIDYAEDY